MTTEALGRKATSACNGVATVFSVPWQFQDGALKVYLLDDPDDDNEDGDLLTEGVDYTVAGDGEAGSASITTAEVYPTGRYIRRWRDTPRAQAAEYVPGDGFPAAGHERQLDRLSMVTEELSDDAARVEARAVRVPAGEEAIVLPAAALRVNKVLGFDATGLEPLMINPGGEDSDLRDDLGSSGDALSSYTAAGPRSALQSVRDRLRQSTVHLMDKIDRAQWAAIEAGTSIFDASQAFADAANLGKRIILPAGTVLANVAGLPSGFTLEGEDRVRSVIRPHDVDARCFTFDSGAAGSFISDIHFARFTFDGMVEDEGFSEHVHLLAMSGVADVLIDEVRFRGFRGDGLILASGHTPGDERHNKRVTVRKCHFDGVNNDNRQCISIIDGVGILVDDSDFENSTRSTMPGAIDIEPDATAFTELGDIVVRGSRFSNIGGNVGVIALVLPSVVSIPTGIAFIGNRFRDNPNSGSDHAIYTFRAPSPTDPMLGLVIDDYRGSNGARPFSVQGARGVAISRFHCQDYTAYSNVGFTGATDFVRDIQISDGYLLRCGTVGHVGLLISDSDRVTVRDLVTDACGSATVAGNGISLHSGGESEHLTIERYRHVGRANQTHAISAIGHTQHAESARTSGNDYGGLLSSVTAAAPGQLLKGTATWNPGSVAAATPATTTIAVAGAALGDPVISMTLSIARGTLALTGEVTAADTVTATLSQPDSDAAGVDLGSSTVTALVMKMPAL